MEIHGRNRDSRRQEKGTTLVITLMIMAVLIVIGMAALMTSSIDLRITGNERVQKQSFYAADAGLNYIRINPPQSFIDLADNPLNTKVAFSRDDLASDADKKTFKSLGVEFDGAITYLGKTNVPEGPAPSGTNFKAYHFRIDCLGRSVHLAQTQLQTQGYIVGINPEK